MTEIDFLLLVAVLTAMFTEFWLSCRSKANDH